MGNDLISRKEVLAIITPRSNSSKIGSLENQRLYSISEKVKSLPTNYDAEKVIQQLEENKKSVVKTIEKLYGKLATLEMADPLKELIEEYTRQQIEIVKSGGIERE